MVETGLAALMWDVVWGVEGDKCVEVLETNETLLKAKVELIGGIRRKHASATQRLRRVVYFLGHPYFKDELCTFKHYDTLRGEDT